MNLKALEGVSENLSQMISERIFNEVGKSGKYTMIERTQAERVLKENQMAMVCADASRAMEVGKILAAEIIVIGSVGKLGNTYSINSRLVSVETGAVIDMCTTDYKGAQEGLLIAAVNSARQLLKLPLEPIPEEYLSAEPMAELNALTQGGQPTVLRAGNKAYLKIPVGNNVTPIELVWIPEGEIVIEPAGGRGTRRVFPVQGFGMSKYEITQEQWKEVMGSNPSRFKNPKYPVENVSWKEANVFCGRISGILSGMKNVSNPQGLKVRLPADTEWEYACRAGSSSRYYTGDTEADLARAGWYRANSKKTTHAVGSLAPNSWGLFDMHGNVSEWCDNKVVGSSSCFIKGGSYADKSAYCAAPYKDDERQGYSDDTVGFRIVVLPQ